MKEETPLRRFISQFGDSRLALAGQLTAGVLIVFLPDLRNEVTP